LGEGKEYPGKGDGLVEFTLTNSVLGFRGRKEEEARLKIEEKNI